MELASLPHGSLADSIVCPCAFASPPIIVANFVAFTEYSGGVWLKDGCQALELTSSKITCGCTHLTDFSVLIDPNGQDAPPKKKKKNKNIPIIAGAAGGGALLLVVIVIVLAMVFKGKCTDSHSQSFGKSERIDTL